jgi:hypothetical protein
MQRSVLEELGLPQDAVRNLLLPHPQPATTTAPPHAQHQHQHHPLALSPATSSPMGPLVVLAAEDAGDGDNVPRAQVFRLVGRLVHMDAVSSLNSRALSGPILSPSPDAAAAAAAGAESAYSAAASIDVALVADGGSGEPATAAAAAAAGFGAQHKRIDAATVGSIATAAATAAASAAVEQLRFVGVGALRAMAPYRGRGGAAAALAASVPSAVPWSAVAQRTAVAGGVATAGVLRHQIGASMRGMALKQHAAWPSAVEPATRQREEGQVEEEDASQWGV